MSAPLMCIGSLLAGVVLVVMLAALFRMAERLEHWTEDHKAIYTSIYPAHPDPATGSGSSEMSREAKKATE